MAFKKGFDPRRAKGGKRPNAGRPKEDIREKFQKILQDSGAFRKLEAMIRDEEGELFIKATRLALEYGIGKPVQQMEVSGRDGEPLTIKVVSYAEGT